MKKKLLILVGTILTLACQSAKTITGSKSKSEPTASARKSIGNVLMETKSDSIGETINYYHQLKRENPETYNFDDESELNDFGYKLLEEDKIKDAIKIFELLVSEFPNAANPYDSLGEAYHIDGNDSLAVKYYEKSLELDPKNINAEDWINRIKYAEYDKSRFSKVYSVKAYKDDLDELGNRLTEVNPNAYKFISKEDFWKAIEEKKNLINEHTTFSEFIWLCSEIIANISCSHTSMGYFYQEREMIPMALRFPIEARLINGTFYILDPLVNKNIVRAKDEIIAINGIPFETIKKEIYKHISSQGDIETYKKNFLNAFTTAVIPYAMGFPKSYEISVKGRDKPVRLLPLTEYENKFQEVPKYLCEEPLCLDFLEDGKSAKMTIRTFAYYGNRFPEYKKFIDESFKELESKEIKNLIIDIRSNGGGPSDAGIFLLRYLTKEPFTYFSNAQFDESEEPVIPFDNAFNGKLYFIMDGNGGSTTGHFMSIVKDLNLAVLIGEELGSNQFCTGGQKRLRLPNTDINYAVGRNTYVTTATSLPDNRGIIPDHEIVQNIDDHLNGVDTIMEYTLGIIGKD
ncbi:S41 family peptidase [Maribacter halichondriae]|uniref:S41 family peptidase n=1 Tax=Maribacter halichondriae TaxID=2980554 RepID=UPI002358FF0A|nr:S41 family peptidase [Maribacter sp. Hal144]